MEDEYKIYCRFDKNENTLDAVMCKAYIDFMNNEQKEIQKNLLERQHNNKKRDIM